MSEPDEPRTYTVVVDTHGIGYAPEDVARAVFDACPDLRLTPEGFRKVADAAKAYADRFPSPQPSRWRRFRSWLSEVIAP